MVPGKIETRMKVLLRKRNCQAAVTLLKSISMNRRILIARDLSTKRHQNSNLPPLSKAARSEVFEFRIWTNLGGLSDPKLLRVYSINSGNSGSIFDLTREKGSLELRKKEPLPAPLSGWNKMLFEVRSRLSTPKGLVREPQFSLNRDEPLIVLEVLDKGDYGRVLYGRGTTFPDGKRLIEVCNYLASEFAVDMDCGGERR